MAYLGMSPETYYLLTCAEDELLGIFRPFVKEKIKKLIWC